MTKINKAHHRQIANAVFSGRRSVADIARQYGVTEGLIYHIVRAYKRPGLALQKGPSSAQAHKAKLTEPDVIAILSLRGKATAVEVAEAAGVSLPAIYKVWQGRTWKATYRKFHEAVD
jgi:transposase-like protein